MGVKSRKFRVWLTAMAVVLVVYLLYSQLSKTPPIKVDTETKFTDAVAEPNSEFGMIDDKTGVKTVEKVYILMYFNL